MKIEQFSEATTLLCEKIDLEKSVIHGVKLLGLNSKNGRTYRESALTNAIPLYENAKVNVNHPKDKLTAPRDYRDRIGVIRNVEFRNQEGLFGDLHFNPKHPCAEMLIYDAQMSPTNVGMSHNVFAKMITENKKSVIEEITKVQSVDLVADPATTAGLFEQQEETPKEEPTTDKTDPPQKPETDTVEALQLAFPELTQQLITESVSTIRINVAAAMKALMAAQLPYGAWDNGMLDQIVQATVSEQVEQIPQILANRKQLVESIRKSATTTLIRSNPKPEPTGTKDTKEFAEALRH